jgi:hypothetical protein
LIGPVSNRYRITGRLRILALTLLVGWVSAVVGGIGLPAPVRVPFERFFTGETLRVDLMRSGTATEERLAARRFLVEGDWPGPRARLIDDLGRGQHLVQVFDAATQVLLFQSGYSTLFQEWQETAEAHGGMVRAFPETVRFPRPRRPVDLRFLSRDGGPGWKEILALRLDPMGDAVRPAPRRDDVEITVLQDAGDPATAVDLVILAEGYSDAEAEKFRRDAARLGEVLFAWTPFKEARDRFSIRAVRLRGQESGTDEPAKGSYRRTAVDSGFDTFGVVRYLTTEGSALMWDLAGQVPYDDLLVLVNTERYGGGGIYRFFSVFVADSEWDAYLVVHEFGHGFAALADEYFTSPVASVDLAPPTVEPWRPNVTALLDPDNLKWKDLVVAGVPLPTPDEDRYDGVVGAFEGASYVARGLYRPMRSCLMKDKGSLPFCPVCERAVREAIEARTR